MGLVDLSQARRAGYLQFGASVTYLPKEGGDPLAITGVYSAPSELVEIGAPTSISTSAPVLGVEREDLPSGDRIGDTLVLGGVTWKVIDVREDGEGGADLMLHRA
jgi:hypothetical protein